VKTSNSFKTQHFNILNKLIITGLF